MPSAVVGILRALLSSNSAEFSRQMRTSSKAVKAFARDANRMGSQATNVGRIFTTAFTLPIVAGGVAVAKLAIDFEKSFAGVRKTVDATTTEFEQLAQGFRDLSREIPINVNEINKVGEAAGQLGIRTENILGFTKVMSLLGVTTNLSADQAATSLARFANITQLAQTDFDRLGSTIVSLGNNFATTEQEIVEMSLRLAGAGNTIGLSEAQILGFAAALSSVGIKAEAGGTAFSRVMIEIAQAVDTGGESLKNFADVALPGVVNAGAKFAKMFKLDAAGALQLFIEGLGNVEDAGSSIFKVLEDLEFGNVRVRDTMLRVANAGDLVSRSLNTSAVAWRENTALTIEAQKRFETTASQITLLWNRVKDLGITLGNALLPMIRLAISTFNRLIPVLEKLANFFTALPVPIQVMGVALLAVLAAVGPLLLIFGQLAFAAASLATAFTASGIATLGFLIPLRGLAGLLARMLPTFTAWGVAAVGAFSAAGARMGFLARAAGGVGIAIGALLPFVAALAVGFGAWKLGRLIGETTGLTDAVERFAARLMGANDEDIRAIQNLRKLEGELARAKKGYDDLRGTLEALAARDMAAWNASSAEAAKRARELADNLPFAVIQMDNLARAVREMGAEGTLTQNVMAEIGRQALALEGQVGKLPPELENIVIWLKRTDVAAEELGEDGGGLDEATEATKEYEKALKALNERLGGRQALQTARLWMDSLSQIGGLTKLTRQEKEELVTVLDAALAKYSALGEVAPTAMMATRDALRLLNDEMTILGTTLEKPALLAFPLGIPLIAGLQQGGPEGGPKKGLLTSLIGPDEVSEFESLLGQIGSRVTGIIIGAIQGGGSVLEAVGALVGATFGDAFGASIAEEIGGALGAALGGVVAGITAFAASKFFSSDSQSTLALAAEGAALGAAIGNSIVPGIGAAFGAGIGALVGLFRGIGRSTRDNIAATLGRDWGLAISDKLVETIAEQAGQLPSDMAAIFNNLAAVIAENGGVLAVGLTESIALTRDLFVMLETGQLTAEQAGAQLELMFGELLPHAIDQTTGKVREDFVELIQLMRRFGLESEVIAKAIDDTLGNLVDVQAQRVELLGQIASQGASDLAALISSGFGTTAEELAVVQRAAVAFFDEMIASGSTFQEALQAMGPSILDIAATLEEMGIEASAGFKLLIEGAKIFADEGLQKILDKAVAAGNVLRTLSTLSIVTASDFSVLGATVRSSFDALVAGGVSAAAAMLALKPQLAILILLQEKYGFEVDAATQALIDQAKEAGITAEDAKSAAELQLEAFDKMIEALERIVVLLGGELPAAVEALDGSTIEVTVVVDDSALDEIEIPDFVIPVEFDPDTGGLIPQDSSVPLPSAKFGTPGLDFQRFSGGEGRLVALHGDEAVIPRGTGHELAAEIADAMGGPGGGITVQIMDGAIRVEGVDEESGERILDGLTEALQRGGRHVTRFVGAVRGQV